MLSRPLTAAVATPLVLAILAQRESYGYEIIQRIHELTDGKVRWPTSTLYPVLHSLENKGLLESFWRAVEKAPRRKYYRLTTKGYLALDVEKQQWLDVHTALMKLWGPQPQLSLG